MRLGADEAFEFQVWSPDLAERVWVRDPESLTFTARHNGQPAGSVVLAGDHKRRRRMNVDGCRYRLLYQDEHLSSGQVRMVKKEGVGNESTFTYTLLDDWRLFTRLLGIPVPGSAATSQGAAEYHTVTDDAESAVKQVLTANLARLAGVGVPVTVATSLGRGATVTLTHRFHYLADRILPVVDLAGVGFTVRHVGAGLVVDAYEPTTWPIRMSEDGGTILASSWSRALPELTRVYVGAGGEGTARVFRGPFINSTAEAALHDWIEGFVDARDISPTDTNLTALVAARAADALGQGSFKAGLSIDLAETPNYRYGGADGLHVGDRVPFVMEDYDEDTANDDVVVLTDVLRSVTLGLSPTNGITVKPTIGDRTDDPDDTLNGAVAAVARRQRVKAGE